MKKLAIAVLLLAALTSTPSYAPAQSGCGIQPIKPIPPIGCKDLVPVCQCNSDGTKCAWNWVCVK